MNGVMTMIDPLLISSNPFKGLLALLSSPFLSALGDRREKRLIAVVVVVVNKGGYR